MNQNQPYGGRSQERWRENRENRQFRQHEGYPEEDYSVGDYDLGRDDLEFGRSRTQQRPHENDYSQNYGARNYGQQQDWQSPRRGGSRGYEQSDYYGGQSSHGQSGNYPDYDAVSAQHRYDSSRGQRSPWGNQQRGYSSQSNNWSAQDNDWSSQGDWSQGNDWSRGNNWDRNRQQNGGAGGYRGSSYQPQGSRPGWTNDASRHSDDYFGTERGATNYGGSSFGSSQDFRGRAPKGYERADERIREDVCECFTHDSRIDPSQVTVQVKSGIVTLEGTVGDRQQKYCAEDLADRVSGVKDVRNQLNVERQAQGQMQGTQHGGTQQHSDTGKVTRQ